MAEEADRLSRERAETADKHEADNRALRERRLREDREVWELFNTAASEFAALARRRGLPTDGRWTFGARWWEARLQIGDEHWVLFRVFKKGGRWDLGHNEYAGDGVYEFRSLVSSEKPGVAPFPKEVAEQTRQALIVKLSQAN